MPAAGLFKRNSVFQITLIQSGSKKLDPWKGNDRTQDKRAKGQGSVETGDGIGPNYKTVRPSCSPGPQHDMNEIVNSSTFGWRNKLGGSEATSASLQARKHCWITFAPGGVILLASIGCSRLQKSAVFNQKGVH